MRKLTILLLFIQTFFWANGATEKPSVAIIPTPSHIEVGEGFFIIDKDTEIHHHQLFGKEASLLKNTINKITEKKTTIVSKTRHKNNIELMYDPSIITEEGYKLNVTEENVVISAKNRQGAFNATQTLKQLFLLNHGKLPVVVIEDQPAFFWRGMLLDVSRHFFSVDYLKKHIQRLALYKFNKLHLHLTDDQGWRLEIKQYPKLTAEGAWRTFNAQDSVCMKMAKDNPNFNIDPRFIHEQDGKTIYGGFYTQEEIKEIIQYAKDRNIEIIPEIDMPGHMMAAINAYPFLVDGEAGWGETFSTPICPCKEDIYSFCKNILSEVIELFPSQYIHIGADEVDKKTWENSAACKQFMQELGIENVNKLQSHFVHEMQKFVESRGKRLIGWDEVLEGGTNAGVTVMYWRGWVKDAPFKAVEVGSELIMTPTNPLYFDYVNNNTSVDNVYHMDIIDKAIPSDKAYLVLGAQANLWTEKIPSEAQADYQTYPRLLALSERLWTNNPTHFQTFSENLLQHYPVLDRFGVNYRLPDIEGFAEENVYVGQTSFFVESPLKNMNIHYTTDGTIPSTSSSILAEPISINNPTQLKMALFSPSGVRGEIYTLNFRPTTLKPAIQAGNINIGLKCDFFDKYYRNTKEIIGQPDQSFVVKNIEAPTESKSFGLRFEGHIDIPETGIYSFFFTCDDGGALYIDSEVVVDNDGQHSPVLKSGQTALEEGLHPFRIDFLEGGGGYTLKLQYSFNGSTPQDIPDSWFKH